MHAHKKIKNPTLKKKIRNRIPMEKTTKEEVSKSGESSANFTQLRDELFHEASQLVAENPGHKIAILISAPPSSESGGISMYSFGNPSAECVVEKYLDDHGSNSVSELAENKKDPTSYSWEDDKLLDSNDPEKLKAAINEIMKLKNSLTEMMEDHERDVNHQEDQSVIKPQG